MDVLALLDDGKCSIQESCLSRKDSAATKCPQAFKCGTCIAWSPIEANAWGRNSGKCLLGQEVSALLDCNAAQCPYYRPRSDNAAHAQWSARPKRGSTKTTARRPRRPKLEREAPPPTPAALARAAFDDFSNEIAMIGEAVLAAELRDAGAMPVLLERFRGGSVALEHGETTLEAPLEALYARLVLVRNRMRSLARDLSNSSLSDDEKAKTLKDLSGMAGSMTTFNLLFKNRDDQFRGQGKS